MRNHRAWRTLSYKNSFLKYDEKFGTYWVFKISYFRIYRWRFDGLFSCISVADGDKILSGMILIENFAILLDQSIVTSREINRFQLQAQIYNIFEIIASWQIADWNTDFTALTKLVQYGNSYKWGQQRSISSVHSSKLFKYEVKWWIRPFYFRWFEKALSRSWKRRIL